MYAPIQSFRCRGSGDRCPAYLGCMTCALSLAVRKDLGIGENLLRMTVGMEDLGDLKEDLA